MDGHTFRFLLLRDCYFYDSYIMLVYLVTPAEGRGVDHPLLTYIFVIGVRVDVSGKTIRSFLFRFLFMGPTTTIKFYD